MPVKLPPHPSVPGQTLPTGTHHHTHCAQQILQEPFPRARCRRGKGGAVRAPPGTPRRGRVPACTSSPCAGRRQPLPGPVPPGQRTALCTEARAFKFPPSASIPRLETVIVAVSLTSFFFPSLPLPLPFLGPLGPWLPLSESEVSLPVPSLCVSLGNRMQFTGRGSVYSRARFCVPGEGLPVPAAHLPHQARAALPGLLGWRAWGELRAGSGVRAMASGWGGGGRADSRDGADAV